MYQRVLFLGSKRSGLNVFQKMVELRQKAIVACVTIDDRTDSRSVFSEIISFCGQKRIPVEILTDPQNMAGCIYKYKPDVCFVMGWYYLIDISLIKQVKGGFIGIHNSLLPSYRGFAPVVWAIINGEKKTGFSVFSFDEGMDTGDIWYQKSVAVEERDYIADILAKIDTEIENFLDEKYEMILDCRCFPSAQRNIDISYGAKRVPADGRIDWKESAESVYDFVRAQSRPYTGAFSYYDDKKTVIWKAEKFRHSIYGKPGQIGIIDRRKGWVVVICGNNKGILLDEIEVDGHVEKASNYIKNYKNRFD